MFTDKEAADLIQDISPGLADVIELLAGAKQSPCQIERHVRQAYRAQSVLPSLCRQAAEHYKKGS